MPAPLLTAADVLTCPHGGSVAAAQASPRVLVSGAPVQVQAGPAPVQGCPLPPPHGCRTVQWIAGASRVFAEGRAVLLRTSPAQCLSGSGLPTGAPLVASAAGRVLGQ